jgi:pimeloyl-ACP methyl ester carboxylesterase
MSRHAARRAPLACAALLLAAAAALAKPDDHAGVVYLKDGHVLKGYVVQPSETIVDPISQVPVTLHKGIFVMDDFCRRFFFSHAYVERAENQPFDYGKVVKWDFARSFPGGKSLPPIRQVTEAGPWNETWDRSYHFLSPAGEIKLTQHLSILTPTFTRVDAHAIDPVTHRENIYPWSSFYRARELGPETVLTLLSRHKDFKDSAGLKPEQRAERRFQAFNILVQAGWLDAAQKELDRIKRDFPDQKDQVETAAEGIKKLVAMDRWDEIKRAQAAGRHQAAQKLLADFPAAGGDDQLRADVQAMKVRYAGAEDALKRARSLLAELPKEVTTEDGPALFTEAAAAIAAEINLDHFLKKGDNDEGRLERFLSQAEQAERLAKDKMPHLRAGELLSLAVNGWLLGSASAETKPEAARRVWEARRFALAYQKTANDAARAALLKDYEGKSGITIAEMAQLIPNLPPPDPPEKVGTVEVEMKPGGAGKGTTYWLKLPPEYHAGRPYPVLIALHHGGETGRDMVKRWGDEAARYGYVLACPDWDQGNGGVYGYSAEEHATVLDTLRDLRQHFNVDSDRVFLTGYGEGGNMAWDVGLSHPDLFAGVAPISGQPRFHGLAYWPNAMELPFYAVWGEYMGGPVPADKKSNGNLVSYNLFKEHWIPGGFPALGVQYKGRGLEWFPAEVPDIFDWMAQKRRHNPLKVGFKDIVSKEGDVSEFRADQRTMRLTDNRFYWVTVNEVAATHLKAAAAWPGNGKYGTVAAKIANGNQIGVFADGVKGVSLWLGRGMIDFEKPITVRLNFNLRLNNVTVKPSMGVLLEDFYARGDRQRLYLARVEVK